MQVTGIVKVLDTVVDFLNSAPGLDLTRQSISHFECVLHSSSLGAYELLTPECVAALAMPELAGATKI
eukprot:4283031-Amphidinium_carterae.1